MLDVLAGCLRCLRRQSGVMVCVSLFTSGYMRLIRATLATLYVLPLYVL